MVICRRCACKVPSINMGLHELRCVGNGFQAASITPPLSAARDILTLGGPAALAVDNSISGVGTINDNLHGSASHTGGSLARSVCLTRPILPEGSSPRNTPLDSTSWKCSQCTFDNVTHNGRCEMCSAPHRSVHETNAMEATAEVAAVCDVNGCYYDCPIRSDAQPESRFGCPSSASRPLGDSDDPNNAASRDAPSAQWSMGPMLPLAMHVSSMQATAPESESWNCSLCSFENVSRDGRCEMCLARRPGFQENEAHDATPEMANSRDANESYYDRLIASDVRPERRFGGESASWRVATMSGVFAGALLGGAMSRESYFPCVVAGAIMGGLLGKLLSNSSSSARNRLASRSSVPQDFDGVWQYLLRAQPEREGEDEEYQDEEALPEHGCAVDTFPTHTLTAEEVAAVPEERLTCTICLEEFREGHVRRTLPCFHSFHSLCVDRWLRRSGKCPICKHHVTDVRTFSGASAS